MLHLREPRGEAGGGSSNSQMFKPKQEAKIHQPNKRKARMGVIGSDQIE